MSELYEGDLIRPLGLVTLYFAYAEAELDKLLEKLPSNEPYDDKMRKLSVGRKIHYAKKLIKALRTEELSGLTATLNDALKLFERRNTVVHSCIFSGGRMITNRKKGAPHQFTSGAELTQLAEQICTCKEYISMHRMRHLIPLLELTR